MASTTSNLGLTKPANGESFSLDVWNQNMQKIDDAFAVTNVTRVQLSGNDAYFEYCKRGQVVNIFAFYKVSVGTIAAWDTKDLGTIPAGFRPKGSASTVMITDRQSSAGCALMVGANGLLYINGRWSGATDSSDILQATLCYVVA